MFLKIIISNINVNINVNVGLSEYNVLTYWHGAHRVHHLHHHSRHDPDLLLSDGKRKYFYNNITIV